MITGHRQRLTAEERTEAMEIGRLRQIENQTWQSASADISKPFYTKNGVRIGGTADHIKGGVAEYGFGLMFGYKHFWQPYNPEAKDVLGYEIRSTFCTTGHLVTRLKDHNGLYVFCVVDKDYWWIDIYGWRTLKQTKPNLSRVAWDTTIYATPQAELWPLELLPATAELLLHRSTMVSTNE